MRGIDRGVTSCPVCHQLVKFPPPEASHVAAYCPRCGSEVFPRKRDSLATTLALVVASIVFYIPANLLPMMHVQTFAGTQSDTIMSGVIYFMETGSYLIGVVIFIASIFVPILKMLILLYLIASVRFGWNQSRHARLKLYNLTELVGRWSMVDVYVVSIMIALVHFGGLTEISAGMGAVFFLLVVIITMVAAMNFDPRLIWDAPRGTQQASRKEQHA
ncbi:paraquat-inducible protein A [Nitratifractor sp.]